MNNGDLHVRDKETATHEVKYLARDYAAVPRQRRDGAITEQAACPAQGQAWGVHRQGADPCSFHLWVGREIGTGAVGVPTSHRRK